MKPALYSIPFLTAIVFFLIRAEFLEKKRQIYILKPIATLTVIAVAALSFLEPTHNTTYSIGVLGGLLFSLGGDIALMFQENRKAFMVGLVLFLLAHVVYAVVFGLLGSVSGWDILSTAMLLAVGIGFYTLIQSNLGTMRVPVIVYILIISMMVNRAASTLVSPTVGDGQAVMVLTGAVLFYISDVILAAARFWKPWRYHRISLAFYYSGQLLIALAASYGA